jgi:hypothetical protein
VAIVDNETIREAAIAAGADTVGFTTADPFPEALETILRRKRRGMAGPLHFWTKGDLLRACLSARHEERDCDETRAHQCMSSNTGRRSSSCVS